VAEFPALPLWTDAYLGDTTHLNVTQHGAYLLLLMTAWRSRDCALPDDDKLLARYARCTAPQWRALRPIIEPFFNVENGSWRQGRLTDEFSCAVERRERAAANGRASALKRKGRHSAKRQRSDNGAPTERQRSENLTINPEHSSEGKPSAAEPPQLAHDPVKELFELGVAILVEGGATDKRARSLLGKWRKAKKNDGDVLAALLECRAKAISDPVEWLEKRLASARYVSATGYEYRGDDEAVLREAERRNDMDTYWRAKGAIQRRASVG
jgi:uncharacterized protein YdaU (DUF1376 family)